MKKKITDLIKKHPFIASAIAATLVTLAGLTANPYDDQAAGVIDETVKETLTAE